jgi:hypothetical protein
VTFFDEDDVQVGELTNDRTGWTVGGGAEWMFAPHWSVFAEYNFMGFGTRSEAFTTCGQRRKQTTVLSRGRDNSVLCCTPKHIFVWSPFRRKTGLCAAYMLPNEDLHFILQKACGAYRP